MSNSENDDTIRVNIRTGTSTRAARIRDIDIQIPIESEDINLYQELIYINSYPDINLYPDIFLDNIIQRSIHDCEYQRNSSIQLNIKSQNCKIADVNEDCSICQVKFKLGEKISKLDACDHMFHYHCLQEWGKYKQECPNCRSIIPILER